MITLVFKMSKFNRFRVVKHQQGIKNSELNQTSFIEFRAVFILFFIMISDLIKDVKTLRSLGLITSLEILKNYPQSPA